MSTRPMPPRSVRELWVRAEALEERSVAELSTALGVRVPDDPKRAKGFVGQLVELALGADPTAGERPDFPDLGVELKTVPLDARGQPAESTFVCSVDHRDIDAQQWHDSRLRLRLGRVLFVPVTSARVARLPERRFSAPRLWEPSPEEEHALRGDWEELIGMLGAGFDERMSAHRGEVLQLRPKGRDAQQRVVATRESGTHSVRPLGFYLRSSFTRRLLTEESSP